MTSTNRFGHFARIASRLVFMLTLLLTSGIAAYAQQARQLTPEDYAEIYNLYSAYSISLDTGNGAGRVATFTPDGTFAWDRSNHQPETMDVLLKRTNAYEHKSIPQGGMHILTNIRIIPTAEGADGSCYAMLVPNKPDANNRYFPMPAYYEDKLVKTVAGWRFKSREVFMAHEWTDSKK